MTTTSDPMNPWRPHDPVFQTGGRWIVRREQAPLAPTLPYRRAAGERPAEPTTAAAAVRRYGWSVDLGDRGLGNTLLGLGLVQALADATAPTELSYTGPRPDLIRRCALPVTARHADGPHLLHTGNPNPVRYQAIPEHPPAWLDLLDHGRVEVHAALPMRYYLAAELALGIGLPATHAPAPTFTSSQRVQPFHVVFVATTSSPDRSNYGLDRFVRIAQTLADRAPAPWTFSMITNPGHPAHHTSATSLDIQVLHRPDPADCVDVFAAAELVIGHDTGLTHLAALTQRPDGTGPQVVAIYGRHSHTKHTTGAERHHAVATRFSQMLSVADRCPVRDKLTEPVWATAASLAALPAEHIADFAARQAGWW